jgi:KDO2-lipid IV(A) lauroyltransferase
VNDVREGQGWTRAQSAKNGFLYLLARAALALSGPLPPPLLRALGRAFGRLAYLILPRARKTALANVAVAFPDLPRVRRQDLVRRAYARLGAQLGDTVALLFGAPLEALQMDDEARDTLELARAEGRGVLFASAHLGPWEHVAATLTHHGFPLTTIAREPYDPRLVALFDRLRARGGVRVIYRGSPGAATRIVRTLRSGQILGAPMDLRSRVPSVYAPFLGRPAATPLGPARIALRTGAAVVVGTAAPGPSLAVTRIPSSDLAPDPQSERVLTARINAAISARIRAMPDAWVWMHPRW